MLERLQIQREQKNKSSPSSTKHGFREFLNKEFEQRRQLDPRYSLRHFARDLGEDPSALSRLLRGKIEIGPRMVKKLSRALLLGLDEIESFTFQAKARQKKAKTIARTETQSNSDNTVIPHYQEIQADTFRVIADWYHFAILELIQLKGFRANTKWIASRLDIPVPDVHLALERMKRVGLIEQTKNGALIDCTGGWSTNIAQPYFDPGHRRMQKQILEKAIRALETIPLAHRDQSAITLAFDSRRVQEAKQWIKHFRRKFNAEFGKGIEQDSVYNLCLSLYPVTLVSKKNKK